jgi:methylenetetrahydrofolate dehydrogenase (NADP+)/methenyltetrahydrofolate cyclohydrolase
MKKELNGRELADYIKERQAKAVRGLKQQWKVSPKLAIIRTNPDKIVDSYMRIKQNYGFDIDIEVDVHTIKQEDAISTIDSLNNDDSVHGIIVQIPLPDPKQTNEILDFVSPEKDVDGLASNSIYDAPTPVAINWLLNGYNIELQDSQIVIVGQGRLVGKPLKKLWEKSNIEATVADKKTSNLAELTREADVLVCATGVPGLITAEMIKENAVIVDAGVSTDSNGLIGDVSPEVREMPDVVITPIKGGVGPLTVTALFENVITSARNSIQTN